MTNKPKAIGTRTETATVRYLRGNGFDGADEMTKAQRIQLQGAHDHGDIGVCPGVMFEVKGGHAAEQASDAQIAAWLVETETERRARGADVAALITKRKGKGAANAGAWWAYLPGWTFYYLADAAAITPPHTPGDAQRWLPDLPAVRVTLAELVELMRGAGYGDPMP